MNSSIKRIVVAVVALGILAGTAFAQDKAVEAIVKKNQSEVEKANTIHAATIKRSNDLAVKNLTALISTRTKSKDDEGVARCKQAIAKINGEEVEDDEGVAVAGGVKYPEGTIKYKGKHYLVITDNIMKYATAEEIAAKHNASILSIDDEKEYKFILKTKNKYPGTYLWIRAMETKNCSQFNVVEFVEEHNFNTPFIENNVNYAVIGPNNKANTCSNTAYGATMVLLILEW